MGCEQSVYCRSFESKNDIPPGCKIHKIILIAKRPVYVVFLPGDSREERNVFNTWKKNNREKYRKIKYGDDN